MSAEKCGPVIGVVVDPPRVVSPEGCDPELCWTDRSKDLLKRIRQREADYSPSTIKALYNKAYRLGLLDEQD